MTDKPKKPRGPNKKKQLGIRVRLPADFPEDLVELSERGNAKRQSSYQIRYAKIAEVLCAKGATDADLASAFGVTTSQIQTWYSKYPEFGEAVRKGKSDVFDPMVERALAQRAIGYTVDTEEVKVDKDGNIIRYGLRKHYPPDPTSAIFWLKNRQPTKWRDVWKVDHSGKVDTSNLTAEQLLVEIRAEAAKMGLLPQQLESLGIAPFPKDTKLN